jgi:insertion element IS1 protein InsB
LYFKLSGAMKCQYCTGETIKSGKQKSGAQKYRCKTCKKYQQDEYKYQAYVVVKRRLIVPMILNNCGFCPVAEVLGVSYNTVVKVMFACAAKCKPPKMKAGGIYEVDEVCAYRKEGFPQIWAAYAIEKYTKQVIGINVGRNNKTMLRKTIDAIIITQPKRIYSDGNPSYVKLIPQNIHKRVTRFLIFIERLHLTVRNKLKMMNRETLSFVRKAETLLACLKLLFWSKPSILLNERGLPGLK